jgi:hypothetical protein
MVLIRLLVSMQLLRDNLFRTIVVVQHASYLHIYWGDHSNIFRADTLGDLLQILPKLLFHGKINAEFRFRATPP